MARKTSDVQIETSEGPAKVTLVQIDGMTAGKAAPMIVGMIAPVAASLGGTSMVNAGEALGRLLQDLSESKLERVMELLWKGGQVQVKGQVIDLQDKLFVTEFLAGHSDEIYKLLYKAIELNYGNFLKPLQSKLGGSALMGKVVTAVEAYLKRMTKQVTTPENVSPATMTVDSGPASA